MLPAADLAFALLKPSHPPSESRSHLPHCSSVSFAVTVLTALSFSQASVQRTHTELLPSLGAYLHRLFFQPKLQSSYQHLTIHSVPQSLCSHHITPTLDVPTTERIPVRCIWQRTPLLHPARAVTCRTCPAPPPPGCRLTPPPAFLRRSAR